MALVASGDRGGAWFPLLHSCSSSRPKGSGFVRNHGMLRSAQGLQSRSLPMSRSNMPNSQSQPIQPPHDEVDIIQKMTVSEVLELTKAERHLERGEYQAQQVLVNALRDPLDHDDELEPNAVLLHVYNLNESLCPANQALSFSSGSVALGGAFHVGTEVFGTEYSYGVYGVCSSAPLTETSHVYECTVFMGWTSLNKETFASRLYNLAQHWRGADYDVLGRNCCSFAADLLIHLGVDELPLWIDRFARLIDGGRQAGRDVVALTYRVASDTTELIRHEAAQVIQGARILYQAAQPHFQVVARKAQTVAGGWATIAGHRVPSYPVSYVCHSSYSSMGSKPRDSIISIATTTADVHRYPRRSTRLSTSIADSSFSIDEPVPTMTPRSSAVHSSGCSIGTIGSCQGNQPSKEDHSHGYVATSNNVAGFAAASSSGLPRSNASFQHGMATSPQQSGERQSSPQRLPQKAATFMVSRVPLPPNPLLAGSVNLAGTGVGPLLANAPLQQLQQQQQQQRRFLPSASRTTSFEGLQPPSFGPVAAMHIQRAASFNYPPVAGGHTPGVLPGLPPAALQYVAVPAHAMHTRTMNI